MKKPSLNNCIPRAHLRHLKLRKLAVKDIGEAYEWYEDKRQGLGEEFLHNVGVRVSFSKN